MTKVQHHSGRGKYDKRPTEALRHPSSNVDFGHKGASGGKKKWPEKKEVPHKSGKNK